MKELKKIIEKANNICRDNKLKTVRVHLVRAIEELKKSEKKEKKKQKQAIQSAWKFDIKSGTLTKEQSKKTIETIEKMIEEEKTKDSNLD